jgi:hypothetical protein
MTTFLNKLVVRRYATGSRDSVWRLQSSRAECS